METFGSPFTAQFNTNYAPSDKEVSQVQEILHRCLAKSRELEEEENKILKTLHSIQQKQTALHKFMDQHRAIISPIRRLAPEILSEIFFQCLVTGRNPAMSAKEAPILLTQICSGWRMLALATPRLWAAIHISVPTKDPPPFYDISWGNYSTLAADITQKRLLGIEQWLDRSGDLPISLSIHEGMGFSADPFPLQFLQRLTPYSTRWTSLSLTIPLGCLDRILDLLPPTFPSLQSLRLNCGHAFLNVQQTWTRLMQCGIVAGPRLQEIHFTMLAGDIVGYAIPWSQLTVLCIESDSSTRTPLSFQTMSWLLRACPNLISLRFEFLGTPEYSSNSSAEHPRTPIRLPSLCNLAIRERTSLLPIFEVLEMPSLKVIEYHPSPSTTNFNEQQPEPPSILAFLTHSPNVIQSLTVDHSLFSKEMLINCLRLCTCLKSLTMAQLMRFDPLPVWSHDSPVDDDFLHQFHSTSPETGYLCPELERFIFVSHGELSEDGLIKFIHEKQSGDLPGLAKLRQIVLHFARGPPPPPWPRLAATLALHRAAGLEAEIIYCVPLSPTLFPTDEGVDAQRESWYSFGVPESF